MSRIRARIAQFRRWLGIGVTAVAILALSATSAGAHTTSPYAGWYVWQGMRTVYTATGGTTHGAAWGETAWKPDGINNRNYYGYNFGGVADYTNNGPNDCVEAWMDFGPGNGQHRNGTVMRHCNTSGNVYGYHSGAITDPVYHWAYNGWDFNVCRAIKDWAGVWHRQDCTNDLGHKPQEFPELKPALNHVSDNALSQSWCVSSIHDATWAYGCRAYLHVI